jgi:hypothetical protein
LDCLISCDRNFFIRTVKLRLNDSSFDLIFLTWWIKSKFKSQPPNTNLRTTRMIVSNVWFSDYNEFKCKSKCRQLIKAENYMLDGFFCGLSSIASLVHHGACLFLQKHENWYEIKISLFPLHYIFLNYL